MIVKELERLRCAKTGNPCGSDTWGNGNTCQCVPCQQWISAFNEGVAAEQLRTAAMALGQSPFQYAWSGRITLDNQAQPLTRICTACSGSGLYVDYGGPSVTGGIPVACKSCNGAGRLP